MLLHVAQRQVQQDGQNKASGCVSNATPTIVNYDVNANIAPASNVVDNAGNVGICDGTLVQRDTQGPSKPSYELRKVNNTGVEYQKNTWTNTNVYQRLSSSDAGIGVSETGWQYSFDDSTWHNFPSSDGNFSFDTVTGVNYKIYDSAMKFRIDDNYNRKIYIRVKDKLGNASSSTHYTVKIDKSSPSCTATGSKSWSTSAVSVTLNCSDTGGSDVNVCNTQNTPTSLTAPATYYVSDNAGNTGNCSINVTSKVQKDTWDSCKTGENTCAYGCDTCTNKRELNDSQDAAKCVNEQGGEVHTAESGFGQCWTKTACHCNDCYTGHNTCAGGWKDKWTDVKSCTAAANSVRCQTLYRST